MPIRSTISILIACLSFSFGAKAQSDSSKQVRRLPQSDVVSLGLGIGLDHGGIGANLTIYPQQNIGVFGGIGYAGVGMGYNGGVKARIFFNREKPDASLFVMGMYGYNTVYKIRNGGSYNKMFFGPTIGMGIETPLRPHRTGYWSFALLVPIRSAEALNYRDYLKSSAFITIEQDLLPVAFSIGYRFAAQRTGTSRSRAR